MLCIDMVYKHFKLGYYHTVTLIKSGCRPLIYQNTRYAPNNRASTNKIQLYAMYPSELHSSWQILFLSQYATSAPTYTYFIYFKLFIITSFVSINIFVSICLTHTHTLAHHYHNTKLTKKNTFPDYVCSSVWYVD